MLESLASGTVARQAVLALSPSLQRRWEKTSETFREQTCLRRKRHEQPLRLTQQVQLSKLRIIDTQTDRQRTDLFKVAVLHGSVRLAAVG